MSLFLTRIPVDLKPLLQALPKGAHIHDITWNGETRQLVCKWEHETFTSGLTVPTEFPMIDLESKVLPEGVRDKRNKPAPAKEPEKAPEVPAVPPPPPAPDYIRTEKAYRSALKAGKKLEFWGHTAIWHPVEPDVHEFTEGFIYREAAQPA